MSGDRARQEQVDRERFGDLEVAYRVAGGGPSLVLIHGLAQDHRMWGDQQDALSGTRTLAYDLRGHGDTSLGDADGTLAQLGGDLVAFLERFGPATCAGFSLGGTVALWAASERPDLVCDVIAIATSSVVGRAAAAFFEQRIALFLGNDAAAIRTALVEDTRSQLATPGIDANAIAQARLEAVGDGRGYINAARAMLGVHAQSLNDRLERITCPVLVVSGERDAFCPPRAGQIMLAHLADALAQEIEGAGHLVTDEASSAVTRVIARWMARVASA